MFHINSHCANCGNVSKLKVGENRALMYVINKQRKKYIEIKIDGCENITGYKCDIGIYLCELNESLLIELKGSDIKHAVEQLEATIKYYNSHSINSKLDPKKTTCFIITSNNPLSSTETQNQKLLFQKYNKIKLQIERPRFEYPYS